MEPASTRIPITEFAPAERVPIEVVRQQAADIARTPLTAEALNSVLNYVFILNPQRQIIFTSKNIRDLLPNDNGGGNSKELIGNRPGELLGCVHADDTAGGCGTTVFCQECGAAKAILASLAGERDVQECRLTRMVRCGEEALDLLISGTPLTVGKETFSLLAILDISHLKRRQAMERLFFHDLINFGGGLERLTEMLAETQAEKVPEEVRTDLQVLQSGLHQMMEEIHAQKDLAAAESGELAVRPGRVDSWAILAGIVELFRKHPVAQGRQLCLGTDGAAVAFPTDMALFRRVLGNLIKNALEAVAPGETVTVGCEDQGTRLRFWVHNPGAIPRDVQLKIFNRSFSTKGEGRGLGTYSVKLLTERYLGGAVAFTSDPEQGTMFCVMMAKE